jgi:1-acyl-sn-glycerol-3-phosphate acyltransferase
MQGIEKLPENTRMLFVCNHQHDFDPVIIYSVFPDAEIGFIGKKEIYKTMPFIARAMHRLNSLPIDRENNREAAKTIVKAIKIIQDDKASIALFPEGYVSKSCELLPFRNGSLKIAMKAQVPIAVCVINNTRSIVKNMFRRRTDIYLDILEVIDAEAVETGSTAELGDRVHALMENNLK